ncbi:MAG: glycosyltransferase family 4 protein [Verrucomicrobia bacterium]|nr:glycosyltransferase family 4 protein [Verrucomicrobiota bacterium]
MNVAIDTTALMLNKAGVHVYLRELLEALRDVEGINLVPVCYDLKAERTNRLMSKLDTLYRDVIWQNLVLPRDIGKAGVDLFHAPQPRTTVGAPVPFVVTVYDLYVYHNPQGYSWWTSFLYHLVPMILRRASVIITISEFSRRELIRFVPGLDPSKIVVTPLGVSERFQPASKDACGRVRQKYNLPERFLLAVNTLEPRKNLLPFLEAFSRIQNKIDEHLVLVGSPGWVPKHAASILETMRRNERIHYVGYVPDEDLEVLYSAASAYVFPSSYEGFGLPAVEAMACGCPVIASKGSSLDEVIGGAGLQFDPASQDEMAETILRMVGSVSLRDTFKAKGFENAARYSWQQTASCTVAAYRKALES